MNNNIINKNLWDTVEKRKADIKRHRIQGWQPETFDSYPGLEVNYLDKQWLSETISTQELKDMSPNRPKLISAQTGTGKSTLLLKKIVPIAIAEGKRVLYLCSRTALAIKVKEDCTRDEVNGELFCGKVRVKELPRLLTAEGIKSRINFGAVDCATYQYFIRNTEEFSANNYSYVYLDEIHACVQDSQFLNQSYDILNLKKLPDK